jgi:hypothetical protein
MAHAPPPARRYSILPAMMVLVIAVVTLFSFAVVDLWVSPTTTPTTLPDIVVGSLRVATSTSVFGGWVQDGLPPSDIASGLFVPTDTTYLRPVTTGGNPGVDFDLAMSLSVRAPRAELLGFYKANLEALDWKLFSFGAGQVAGTDELLFEKGGANGDDWDLGVIAQATTHGATVYEFRLFDVGDNE